MNEKQEKILNLVSQGMKAKQVGLELGISQRTVEKELEILRAAYGAKNTPHLIALVHGKSKNT